MEEFAELICIADKPYMKRIFNLLNQELLYLKQLNIQIPTVEMVGTKEIKHSQGLQEPGSSHEWFNSYHSEPHIQSRERNYRIHHLESPRHHTEQYITHLKDGNWSIFMQQGANHPSTFNQHIKWPWSISFVTCSKYRMCSKTWSMVILLTTRNYITN